MGSRGSQPEAGFTLIELLVTMTILAVASIAFYQLLFSVAKGTDTAEDVARVSDEARLGFARMVRDTREGEAVTATTTSPESFTVAVDFDQNGVITPYPATNPAGDYEELIYKFESGKIRLNGELLMDGVSCVPVPSGGCAPVFDYSSGELRYDWNGDGVTTWRELDAAAAPSYGVVGVGNNNGVLDSAELPFITQVEFNVRVTKGDSATDFYSLAQLRNNR